MNGELNLPSVLRNLNGAVAVQNSLSPAIPAEVRHAAQKFIDAILELTTAATSERAD